ncbi:lysozyme inhibitor LprI family protein [Labrys okinawensis]|nr:lysozyme inhibitor LprI family protein [Labrys okinawensis]
MSRLAAFSLLFLGLASMPALAAPAYEAFKPSHDEINGKVYSRQYDDCAGRTEGVTAKITDCIDDEFERVDKKLNTNYQAVLRRLQDEASRETLRQSQREWLKSRWNACDSGEDGEGGQAAMIDDRSCRLEELARRTLWLQSYGR